MQKSIHKIASDEDLLTQMSLELDAFSDEELRKTLIVLPTQRLGQYLLAILAKKRISFLAPKIITLETWIHSYTPESLASLTVLSASAEELILASLLKQSSYRHLQKGHEHEIREFFSQIDQVDLGDSVFPKLKALIQKDIYRDDSHIGTLVERIHELSQLYIQYQNLIKNKNAMSSDNASKHCIKELIRKIPELGESWIFLGGFSTVKHYCRPLFKILSERKNTRLIFSEAPKLLAKQSPLEELLEYLSVEISPSKEEELPLLYENTEVIACDSVYSETQEAITCVRDFIEAGCAPSRIGLLLTNEKVYGKILIHSLEKETFKSNLAIAQDFVQCPVGSWLYRLFQYLLSLRSYDRKGVEESQKLRRDFIAHPWTWKALGLSEEDLKTLLYDLAMSKELPHPALNELSAKLHSLQKRLGDASKDFLKAWIHSLKEVCEAFALNTNLEALKTSEQEAFKQFLDFTEQWSLCWEYKVSGSEFLFALVDKVQSLEVRSVGFPLEGVQILDLIEARYVPFDVLIVLGCVEGRFPRTLPNDRLVSDMLKVRLGMPGWQYIEALEDTTFHLLCRQAKYFRFLYSLNPDYGTLCRSRFVERILSTGKGRLSDTKLTTPSSRANLEHERSECEVSREISYIAPPISKKETPDNKGHYTGDRYKIFEHVSAHSLTQLFRCPYEFLLSKLGVKTKQEDSPSLWEGRWVHEILEAFYTGRLREENILEALPSHLVLKADHIPNYAFDRLRILTEHCLPHNVKGSPFHLHLLHFAWPRFAEHWAKFFEEESPERWVYKNKFALKEHPLTGKGLPLDRNTDRWSSMLGTLDSLDVFSDSAVLVDYKRKNVDSLSDVVKGLSPQLPLYALAIAQNKSPDDSFLENCLVGYWSIVEGRWQARGVGEDSRKWALSKKLASPQTPVLNELVNTLKSMWDESVNTLLHESQNFSPIANDSCEYCPFSGICRVEENAI